MIIGLTADSTSLQDLRTIADWTIRPRLLSTGGVAQVAVIGGDIKEYQILLSPEKMRKFDVSVDEVLAATENMNLNSSGGVLYEYGNEYIVRGIIASKDADKIARNFIKFTDKKQPVTLEDVARVQIGAKLPRLGVASEKTKPAVLITVTKQMNTSTIDLTNSLDHQLADLSRSLPPDIHISTDIFRQSRFIDSSIENIRSSLFEGAIFVVIVLFFFLMNGRVTIISLVALPLSLLVTILVLKMLGMTINTMSLGGMAIAIGSLVDDAIIDVENVYRRLRENHLKPEQEQEKPLKMIYDASTEIRSSIVHATVITMVSFVPLFFLSG